MDRFIYGLNNGETVDSNLVIQSNFLIALLSFLCLILLFSNISFAEPVAGEIRKVVRGDGHTCAITANNKLYCWGNNVSGQVGNGAPSMYQLTPDLIGGALADKEIKDVSLGLEHTCAVTTDGKLYCWGGNINGQVGNNSDYNRTTPTRILPEENIDKIALKRYVSCAITVDHKLYCWGGNGSGQVGDGTNDKRKTPYQVKDDLSGKEIRDVSLGTLHICAITTDNKLYCWGYNSSGQVGNGKTVDRRIPCLVESLSDVKEVSLGDAHTCAITTDNKLYCWGNNAKGQVGDTTLVNRTTPVQIDSEKSFSKVVSDGYGTCAISTNDKLYCWGVGSVGDGSNDYQTEPVFILADAKDITLRSFDDDPGHRSSCAVTTTNKLYCWGSNGCGVLGDGTVITRLAPVPVLSTEDIDTVTIKEESACAITAGKKLYCWGGSGAGEVGNGETGEVSTPAEIFDGGVCSALPNFKEKIGKACNNGELGQCYKEGTIACNGDSISPELICNAKVGTPTEEICDGKDNDCNGEVDDGLICTEVDECPDDPNKTKPGVCGCNIADIDSDGDGTLDCQDSCPNDKDKTEPGECGCNEADIDSDGDGTFDCQDSCPDDKYKTEPGECGCNEADIDSDGDGVLDCNDECPEDKEHYVKPEVGCFINGSNIPERYDPNVAPDETRVVTPKTKLLPPLVVVNNKKTKATIYFERFNSATTSVLPQKMHQLEAKGKKIIFKYEVRITARNNKTNYRATTLKVLKSSKNSIKINIKKGTLYNVQYRVVIKQGKKVKRVKWSKAVKVKK